MEFDADSVMVANTMFDADDVAAAVYELDQRYLAGEGAEHAAMVRTNSEAWRAYNAREWASVRGCFTTDVRFVDHEPLGAGDTIQSADRVVEFLQGLVELVPDVTAFDAEHLAIGALCTLSRHVAIGTSVEGADVNTEYPVLYVMRDGRVIRMEAWAPEQLAEALARFEELEATDASAVSENRATAAGERARAAALRGDRAATLDAFAPDFVRIEGRRRAISGDRVVGRDLYVDGMLAGPDAGLTRFDATTLEVVGDDHALTHVRWHNGMGFAQEWLFVGVVDEAGRLRRIANFDPEDRAVATALLHEWAATGPRAGDRMSVSSVLRLAALDRGDRDAVLATYTPDFVREDRRRGVNFGVSNREETVDALLAGNDVGLGHRSFTTVEVVDDEHALVEFRMSHADGFEIVYLLAVESDEEGRLRRAANFDLEDRESASALLADWVADREGPFE
jgi:ketosteroid isomerase-like protein